MFPYFSPDAKSIAFSTPTAGLRRVSLSSGRVVELWPLSLPWTGQWSPDGHIYYREDTGVWKISEDGGRPVQLPEHDSTRFTNIFNILPGAEWALVSTYRGGSVRHSGITALNLVTGERRELVTEGAHPHYLPSGHLIYSRGPELLAAPFDAESLEITGDARVVIDDVLVDSAFEIPYFAVSPAGVLVYASGTSTGGGYSLVWVDRQGQVEPISTTKGNYMSPRLSPDGRKIVYGTKTEYDIWVWDIERGGATKIDDTPTYDIWPEWIDDDRVIFTSWRASFGELFSKTVSATGDAESVEFPYPEAHIWSPDINPDGLVAVAVVSAGDSNIGLIRLQDPEPKLRILADTPSTGELTPRLSPDGRWVVFSTTDSDGVNVHISDLEREGSREAISVNGGTVPFWSRDGKEIFFRTPDDKALMVVDVTYEPEFKVSAPRKLLDISNLDIYDVDLAGERFLAVQNPEREPITSLKVIFNWDEELKRLVPTGGEHQD